MKIKFEVKKIIFRNIESDYTIMAIALIDYPKDEIMYVSNPIAVGNFFVVNEGDEFEATAEWIIQKKYGYQLKITTHNLVLPVTDKGMIRYLERLVKRIGKKTSRKIVNQFHSETFNIIKNDYKRLSKIKGISEVTAKRIHDSIMKQQEFEKIALFLLPIGATYSNIIQVYDEFGKNSIDAIKNNPYILLEKTKINFKICDKIAYKIGIQGNDLERIRKGILFYIRFLMNKRGDLFVCKSEIINNFNGFLQRIGAYPDCINRNDIEVAIKDLIALKKIIIEIDSHERECVYISYYNYIENSIVTRIKKFLANADLNKLNDKKINNYIDDYEKNVGYKLAINQKKAIIMTLNNKISILSGCPGTGKTQTINALIYCIKQINPNYIIELCAPTGRAAKRMTELTGMEAKTIHRLLGIKEFAEKDIELVPIMSDFLVIDESSMIDAHIFYNLLSMVSDKTKILIVGDYEQLPSVGVGLILRDLMNSKIIETTLLKDIFRQSSGSKIITNSHNVINGNKKDLVFDNTKSGDFYFIETNNIKELLLKSIHNLIKNKNYKLEDIQVLTVMNKGDFGVVEINKVIQNVFNPFNTSKPEIRITLNKTFRLNDRVIQTVNNYDIEVFNGEIGKIINIDEQNCEITVDFDNKIIVYTEENINELMLSYAITVHKSQGSEFPVVIMLFHSSLNILLNKNIIYTGWTRARNTVVCIGNKNELLIGIDKIDNTIRNSLIKEKLAI